MGIQKFRNKENCQPFITNLSKILLQLSSVVQRHVFPHAGGIKMTDTFTTAVGVAGLSIVHKFTNSLYLLGDLPKVYKCPLWTVNFMIFASKTIGVVSTFWASYQ